MGGFTTLVDMPLNNIPATVSVEALQTKLKHATQDKLFIDVGFLGGIVPGSLSNIETLYQAGVLGFKSFMIFSGDENFQPISTADLKQAVQLLQGKNMSYMIHAELPLQNAAPVTGDPTVYDTYLQSRPSEMELTAIEQVIHACQQSKGVNCHIVHVASGNVLPLLERGIKEVGLSAETCTHYLTFASEEIPNGRGEFKCAPPIRSAQHREQLWQGLRAGTLSSVTSDHAPCDKKNTNYMDSCGGIIGLQYAFPALWTGASVRGFTLQDLVKWRSEEPAKLVALAQRKGKLLPGFDADLIVVDENATFLATEAHHLHTIKKSPYLNRPYRGTVLATMVQGKLVQQNGIFASKPQGSIIMRV